MYLLHNMYLLLNMDSLRVLLFYSDITAGLVLIYVYSAHLCNICIQVEISLWLNLIPQISSHRGINVLFVHGPCQIN